ncbi:capsid cement protein [Acidovorax cavernicola]|uniref:DUF2190 family protein n=1 Tax=Acidovorax cavernicola TaxID=1675792 RepID=A0A9X8D520_9BURK|nr:capsid cement protein [Acidovorax cavernicola]RIX79124.1 DUF2190 family protein [Acidovorax cavernicola]
MNNAILTLTVIAAAATATARFVTTGGVYPAAGGKALGVARFDAAIGDPVAVDVIGTAMVECGAAVVKDDFLMVDATGRVVPLAGSAKHPCGRALAAGAAAGAVIEVLLTPSTGIPTV